MDLDREKLGKAKAILEKMANGINPINGQPIQDESFLQDPRMIRCLFYVSNVLQLVMDGKIQRLRPTNFVITPEEKSRVKFPEYKIGVNEFSKCINEVIDPNKSKKLTGAELNKQLKKMGILSEIPTENGRVRTTINEKSKDYGIEIEIRTYKDREYEMVVFNDAGKRFLLENIEYIMSYEKDEA